MKAVFACALVLLGLVFPSARAAAQSQLTYTVEAVPRRSGLRLSVDLSFSGGETGHTRLHLPSHFSGQRELYKNVQGLTAVSPGVTLADTDAPDVKRVTFPPGQTVHLHYEVAADENSPSGQPGAYFRPALQPGSFHFIGTTVWAYPAQYGQLLSVTLHWKLPAGWTFCDSFGAGQADQQFGGTLEQFLETVYVGGDFRVLTVQASGRPVTVALRGKWKFSDSDFAALAGRIVATERGFWRDSDFPYYLVTLIPAEQPAHLGSDDGGVELTHAVALFQPKSRPLDFELKYVLAHELFHEWNADQMQTGDAPLYWFSEGFTDYYARLLLLRGGLISLEEYARGFNTLLREYAESPDRNRRGEEAARGFYSGTALARLPYQQGVLLAAHWNAAIRSATSDARSLDDVLRDLKAAAAPVTADAVAAALRHYGVPDAAGEVARIIESGETLAADPRALGPGFTLHTKKMPQFELGFDGAATMARRTVAGVKPGSRAYWAGLRDGQEVLSCAPFVVGDPNQRLSLTVRDSAGMKDVEFTPVGDSLPVPQYARDKGAATDGACLAWFGNLPGAAGH